MALSDVVKTKRDGALSFSDGAGTPLSLTTAYEAGDFNFTVGLTRLNFLDRGALVGSARKGDDVPVSGSFSVYFREATNATEACIMDILNWAGYVASNWTSTLTNTELKTLDLTLAIEGSDYGDAADHSITIPDCSFDYSFAEGEPNVVNVNFESHTATVPTTA